MKHLENWMSAGSTRTE